jgi:hypothetical protein
MRSEYSIIIEPDEKKYFSNVLVDTGINCPITVNSTDRSLSYRANLSKYELLYLRLTCRVGKIKPLTTNELPIS